jgi:ABC-type transport system involved in multi-copper enzyme maturation permease subunit
MSLWLLIPVGGLLLNASTCFPTDARLSKVESSIGYGCALLLVVAMFASVMLTFISNVLIGELSLLHLGLGGEYNGPVRIAQGRMATLMGSGLVSWSAAAAAVSYTTLAIGGIDRFPAIADPSSAEVVGRLLESCYFVTLAAVGVTEIAATSAATKLLMLLIIFLGLSLVAFLIGLLVGIVGDTGNPRGETEAHHGAHEPFPDLPEQTHPEISTRSAAHKLALAAGGIAAIAVGVNAVRRICR